MRTNTAPKAKPTAKKSVKSGALPLGRVQLTVNEPAELPIQQVEVTRGEVIQDINGIVEQIGILNLVESMKDPLVAEAKSVMLNAKSQKLQSPNFVATISGGGPTQSVDLNKFLAKCKEHKIPQETINKALSVTMGKVSFLSDDDLRQCCISGTPRSPSLTVELRKDVPPIQIAEAIQTLANNTVSGVFKVPSLIKSGKGSK